MLLASIISFSFPRNAVGLAPFDTFFIRCRSASNILHSPLPRISRSRALKSYGDQFDEFPSPRLPSNKYPPDWSEEQVIAAMIEERTLDNDRWQSLMFKDKHTGQWDGSFEVLLAEIQEGTEVKMNSIASGKCSAIFSATNTFENGCNVTIAETYDLSRSSPELSSQLQSLFLNPTRSFLASTDFRTSEGNQAIGDGYTVGNATYVGEKFISYVSEVAIREGPLRIRVRYVYHSDKDKFDISLVGCVVIRESMGEVKPDEMSVLSNPYKGQGIYDPQAFDNYYFELDLEGRLSLYFPAFIFTKSRNVLTMDWHGKNFRYQLDRKFTSVREISTFELTEIKPEDSLIYTIDSKVSVK